MQLPAGFRYRVDQGADSFEGHFTSADGVVVRHDIGGYAGAFASKRRALVFQERVVGSARVWFAQCVSPDGDRGSRIQTAVTFPDSGCANFYTDSSKPEAVAAIKFIASSAHLKKLGPPVTYCEADR